MIDCSYYENRYPKNRPNQNQTVAPLFTNKKESTASFFRPALSPTQTHTFIDAAQSSLVLKSLSKSMVLVLVSSLAHSIAQPAVKSFRALFWRGLVFGRPCFASLRERSWLVLQVRSTYSSGRKNLQNTRFRSAGDPQTKHHSNRKCRVTVVAAAGFRGLVCPADRDESRRTQRETTIW